MSDVDLRPGVVETERHRTAYLEAGPADGPLMIFVHGWPELGLIWRAQIVHFAAAGWHCVAPDMRGYGGSSVPTCVADYSTREITADLVELHDALGGDAAVWVGHDWGCAPVWAMAAHHPERCRGVAALCVPYFAQGFTLPAIAATVDRGPWTVDRALYPADEYPVGQWDYWLYHRSHAGRAADTLGADIAATIATFYCRTDPDVVGRPSKFADLRAKGGFFGPAGALLQNSVRGRSRRGSMSLGGWHDEALTGPVPHDELVGLQRRAAQAGLAADLAGLGDELARAA